MTRRLRSLASALALSLLCGCTAQSFIDEPTPPQIYLLNPHLGPSKGAKVSFALAVSQPSAPFSLASRRIAIQRSATTLDYYANAVWQDRTPRLLQRLVVEGFENSGRITAVAGTQSGLQADYLLQLDLRRFDADYLSLNGAPRAELSLAARLIRLSDRKVVATTRIRTQAPAQQNSIKAAVTAFDQATAKAVTALIAWTLAASQPAAPQH
jgi:cholesterol transport system auxiliary component